MSRYIDADALIEMLSKKKKTDYEMGLYNHGALTDSFIRFVERQPTADVVEVRHGYNKDFDYPSLFECSVCGWSDGDTYTGDTSVYNYCPNCGAKMDGKP